MNNYPRRDGLSALGRLRALIPTRRCEFHEALRVAEIQAQTLLQQVGVETAPIPSEVVSEMPRVEVQYRNIPMSGLSYWNGTTWIIALKRSEPMTRQRFTLFHEYKHIVDHGKTSLLYTGTKSRSADQQAELAADYFAGCALMPRHLLKRAWASGLQTPAELARHFETSERAISVRLAQVGLVDQTDRHGGGRRYYRGAATKLAQSMREAAA